MNKRLMIAIFSIGFIVRMVSSDALAEVREEHDIAHLYGNILIGELFPSGNVYMERFSLSGGFDNQQHFEGLKYSEEIEIYPLKNAEWTRLRASFNRLVRATYIGEAEKTSIYFSHPFSKARQDALLYTVEEKRTEKPMTVVSFNKYKVEKMICFGDSDRREYSHREYQAAMKRIRDDHERKDKSGSTLSKISEANTILNARKIALFHIENLGYDVLLSVYDTHGIEYASTVYVLDFIKNGKIVLTKEKYNIDGPY